MTPTADDLRDDLDALKRRVVAMSVENDRLWEQCALLCQAELYSPGSTFSYRPVPLVPPAAPPFRER